MKKIICICICICIFLSSGCGKLLDHGRPADTVVEYKGSEAPHSLTSDTPNASAPEPSNTPAPTPEPSKSVPSSDTADTGSSVKKYAVNALLCVVALAVVTCAVIYRRVSPEIFENVYIVPEPKNVNILNSTSEQLMSQGYKRCYYGYVCSTSYIWRFFKKVKNTIYHWSYFDFETKQPIRGMPALLCKAGLSIGHLLHYKPELAPNQ
ncbi:MAG: hypothetical protein LE169_04100 [Endomicrobium sp.]|nr:hypothetical protein [Endomicrobium sp.]